MTDSTDPLVRAAPLRASTWSAESMTVEAILSTGAAVTRYDSRGEFQEVLNVNQTWPTSIPLLDSHSRGSVDDRLGEVINIRTVNGEVIGLVKLSRHNERAKRVAAELSDGATYAISIGYAVTKWTETKPAGKRTLTAQSFELLEASLTTVPADRGAGLRSDSMPKTEQTNDTPPVATRAEINAAIRAAAKAAGLGQDFIDTHVDAESDIATVNAAALAALQARTAAAGTVHSITVGTDHSDPVAIRSAMSDALAHRIAPGVVKLEGRATEYRGHSVLDMVGDIAVARGERINLRDREALLQRAVGAHSTSDFPLLLADAANKSLLAQYGMVEPTYRKWAARKPISDFKDHSFLRVGDVPAFTEITESGEVKYGTISENAEKIRAKEYGTGIAIGRRALINDDLSALSDFSSGIAMRAANDENKLAYGVLATNAALSDTVALFASGHGNLAGSGGAIDATTIGAAVAAMRAQKSLDGMVLNLQPAYLVVGPAYETAARLILATVNATKSSDVNVWSNFAELVVDANITGNTWYLFASPAAAPVVVYGYVGSASGPVIRSERDFDTQAVKVAASNDFAIGAIDFRGAYKNAGA
jgi:HK97 family phage prohead protease